MKLLFTMVVSAVLAAGRRRPIARRAPRRQARPQRNLAGDQRSQLRSSKPIRRKPAMALRAWTVRSCACRAGAGAGRGRLGAAQPRSGRGRRDPLQAGALAKKKENQENWLTLDPEIKCYLPGVPRATYMPYPFQIFQKRTADVHSPTSMRERCATSYLKDPGPRARGFLDGAIGRTLGGRDAGDRRDGLQRPELVRSRRAIFTATRCTSSSATRAPVRT